MSRLLFKGQQVLLEQTVTYALFQFMLNLGHTTQTVAGLLSANKRTVYLHRSAAFCSLDKQKHARWQAGSLPACAGVSALCKEESCDKAGGQVQLYTTSRVTLKKITHWCCWHPAKHLHNQPLQRYVEISWHQQVSSLKIDASAALTGWNWHLGSRETLLFQHQTCETDFAHGVKIKSNNVLFWLSWWGHSSQQCK